MRVSSIISEYNPFHEGHKYHMENTKKITNCDYTIVLMSGDFTQRGTPAILDKYARTKQALLNGADLVLELPVAFATSSAEGFAFGAVSILDKLGIVNSLVFGSESGDIECIKNVADFLSNESVEYKDRLQLFLKQGFSFPKARTCVLKEVFPDLDEGFLSSSNNILGIEYCRALKYFNSSIIPMTIARIDNSYNDEKLAEIGKLSSATAIRNVLLKKELSCTTNTYPELPSTSVNFPYDSLSCHMPQNSLDILKENWEISAPVCNNDFSLLLKYKLLLETRETLVQYLDITSDLADRIYNNLNLYKDFDSFCDLLKTKEMTHARISRSLLHVLLNIKKDEYKLYKKGSFDKDYIGVASIDNSKTNHSYGQYARILGFRKDATPLLREIKNNSSIPLISKLSDSIKKLDGIALSMLENDIQSAHIYESVVADKFGVEFRNEFQRQLIKHAP